METELEMEVEIWLESILLTVDGANGLNEREIFIVCGCLFVCENSKFQNGCSNHILQAQMGKFVDGERKRMALGKH